MYDKGLTSSTQQIAFNEHRGIVLKYFYPNCYLIIEKQDGIETKGKQYCSNI